MFVRRFGLPVPSTLGGWVVTALALAFLGQTFWAVDRHSHSATDTPYGIYPYWVPTFLLHQWLAAVLSRGPPRGST